MLAWYLKCIANDVHVSKTEILCSFILSLKPYFEFHEISVFVHSIEQIQAELV